MRSFMRQFPEKYRNIRDEYKKSARAYTTMALVGVLAGTGAYGAMDYSRPKEKTKEIVCMQKANSPDLVIEKGGKIYTIGLRELFEIITEYDIQHKPFNPESGIVGMATTRPYKMLFVDARLPKKEQISTQIHEIIHAYNFEHSLGMTEEDTLKLEKEFYRKLFGD